MKLWVLQQGRNFGSHMLTFHHWIRLIFGYVIILNVTYILTGGIANSRLCLRAVTGGIFLENHPSRQLCSSAVISSFHHWIGLDFGYVIHPDVIKLWTVWIGKEHSYQKLYFPNSKSPYFRSVQYCSDIGRFNRWMYVNFGYVILMMMMYNSTVWIYWILNLQNDVLSLVWEILNENLRFSIKSMFWD